MTTGKHYQWGFVAEAQCPSCDVHSELWTHSAKQVDYHTHAMCVFCHANFIRRFIDSYEYDSGVDSGLEGLLDCNPVISPDIYGEAKPFCESCGTLFIESTIIVEALDANGVAHNVHELCALSCDTCDDKHMANRLHYTYSRMRHRQFGYSIPPFSSMYETLDREDICQNCYDNSNYVECEHCSKVGDPDYYFRYGNSRYCESCYEDNVYSCDDCDETYWADDGHDCNEGVIKQWDYKPDPEFYKHTSEDTPTYYLGLELEVENTNGSWDTEGMADIIQDNYLGSRAYLKHDGSISDGFEIVTHPHTLEAMRSDFNWSALDKLRESGFRSWNASNSSCGIHVHVSRTAFGSNDRRRVADHKRDAHMLRFMKLIYDNQRQVERLAGRQSNRWANFADKGQLVSKVKHGCQENGRYSAVNTDNYATLEVRVFKGSLKKERVLSALEFVTASVEYTRDLKVTATNKALTWAKFLAYVVEHEDIYPNLMSKISDSLATETISN